MKKNLIYIIIGMAVMIFAGCKNNDQETNFIPTISPDPLEEEVFNPEDMDENSEEDNEDSENEDPFIIGETTTKYVKLSRYGAILNVRSAPTTEEDNVVGFLVHTEPVEVISIEDGWASFLYKGQVSYVSEDYLVDFVPPYISPPTPSQ